MNLFLGWVLERVIDIGMLLLLVVALVHISHVEYNGTMDDISYDFNILKISNEQPDRDSFKLC